MVPSEPMEPLRVHAPKSVASAVIRWRRATRALATVVAKVTYAVDRGRLELVAPEPLVAGESVDPACGLLACDEVVPLRPRADVLVVGCLTKSGPVRLVYRRGGRALVDRHAVLERASAHGASLAPFGPLNRGTAERAVLGAWPSAGPLGLELDAALDPRLFQTAPPAQQIDTIEPHDVLLIETDDDSVGLAVPALSMVCSVRRLAVASKHGTAPLPPVVKIDMRADALSFDVERRRATFTFRCQVALEEAQPDPVLELLLQTPSPQPSTAKEGFESTAYISPEIIARASVGTPFDKTAPTKSPEAIGATTIGIPAEVLARAITPFKPGVPGAPPPPPVPAPRAPSAAASLLGSGTTTLAPDEVARARELAGIPPFLPGKAEPAGDPSRAAVNVKLALSATAMAPATDEIAKARAAALAPFMKTAAKAQAARPQAAEDSALPFGATARPASPPQSSAGSLTALGKPDTLTLSPEAVAEARAKAMPFGAPSAATKGERKSFHVPAPIRVDSGTASLPGELVADLRAQYAHLRPNAPAPAAAPPPPPAVPTPIAVAPRSTNVELVDEESLSGLGAAFLEALARVDAA